MSPIKKSIGDQIAIVGFHAVFPASLGLFAIDFAVLRSWVCFAALGTLMLGPLIPCALFCDKKEKATWLNRIVLNGAAFALGSWLTLWAVDYWFPISL